MVGEGGAPDALVARGALEAGDESPALAAEAQEPTAKGLGPRGPEGTLSTPGGRVLRQLASVSWLTCEIIHAATLAVTAPTTAIPTSINATATKRPSVVTGKRSP